MREINKTIYKILKMEEPVEGVNVSQLITDDLIQKSESGEVKAKGGASDLLNKKADLIHGKSTNLKKNLKASGARVTATGGSTSAGTKKVVKKVIKKAGSTGSVKVTKKVIKKSGTKTGTRVVKKKPTSAAKVAKQKSSPLPMIILLIVLAAGAGYYYMEFMQ